MLQAWIWDFLATEGFQPHGTCLLWRSDVFWAHVVADVVIALSYFSIPLAIVYFAIRRRADIAYGWILYLFGSFIVACGLTHVFGIWTMWVPDYGVQAAVKVGTAAVSATTAAMLWPLMPRLLALPSPRTLEEKNVRLAREVAERTAAEERLHELNGRLESHVAGRTASLARSNAELRRARAKAERSSKAKADFLASMSHEIRTPMNGVLGMLELLRTEDMPAEQARYVEIARESAASLLTVINDILDYSRIEAGSIELEATRFSPAKVVEQTVALLGEQAAQKGLALEAAPAGDVPEAVTGDPTRVRQVLVNLVGNAIKFTDAGRVRVEFRQRSAADGTVELWFGVRDTGIGIAPDAQPRIFSRFSQADSSTARKYGGSGLGLAISKELAELLGGEIGVESAPGQGSLFWFTVRCGVPRARSAAAPERPAAPVTRPLRILVAEDNEVNQLLVKRLLTRCGHAVEVVGSGAEAVAAVERGRYDLVLMDVHMPGMDGVTATRRIRALPSAAAEIPIVALTANAMAGDRELYLAAGMSEYVSKPIDTGALLAAIARALNEGPDVAESVA
jgi:signal transduction histidine kinase/CheY-like chemotaxis protein